MHSYSHMVLSERVWLWEIFQFSLPLQCFNVVPLGLQFLLRALPIILHLPYSVNSTVDHSLTVGLKHAIHVLKIRVCLCPQMQVIFHWLLTPHCCRDNIH